MRFTRWTGWRLMVIAAVAGVCVNATAEQPPTEVTTPNSLPVAPIATDEGANASEPSYALSVDDDISEFAPQVRCTECNPCTDAKKTALAEKEKTAYKGVFYANDFSYLDDPCYDGHNWGDCFKRLAGGRLDLGGESRVRYHHENNMRGFGLTGVDDEFWLTRYRMLSNWRITDDIRFFGEYLYADSSGETFAPRAIEENHGEAQNLFVDAKLFETDGGKLTARVGRQELLFGNQRLISPLDWANTRRTFDGYRLMFSGKNWDIDGFYTNPLQRNAANVKRWDSADSLQDFYGVYATRKGLDIGIVDAYYLGYNNDNPTANFDYHTIGSRVAGGTDLLYEVEGGVQFGNTFQGADQGAGFFTGGLGRKLAIGDWKPIVWAWYDWASGGEETPVARGDNGFDHAFPLAHKYNGFMDLFGRRNLNDINMQFISPIGKKVSMLLWYHYLFLDQKTTPYDVIMRPSNTTALAGDRELGHEIDLLLTANLTSRNSVLVGYSFFDSGKYYDTTPGVATNADADFFYFQYQTQF